jgi:dCMP deaminase
MNVPNDIIDAAKFAALESDCDRLNVGAVVWEFDAIGEPIILSAGHNRSPRGSKLNCRDHGHLLVDGHCVRTSHAEQVALAGIPSELTEDSFIHITHTPCPHCLKQIIESGIIMVSWETDYGNAKGAKAVLGESKLKWGRVEKC